MAFFTARFKWASIVFTKHRKANQNAKQAPPDLHSSGNSKTANGNFQEFSATIINHPIKKNNGKTKNLILVFPKKLDLDKLFRMMRGKLRRYFFIDLLPGRICIAGVEVRKRALCAIEQSAGALEGDDRVVERRFLGIVRDRLDFLQLLSHSSFDRGDEMLVLNLVEGRVLI